MWVLLALLCRQCNRHNRQNNIHLIQIPHLLNICQQLLPVVATDSEKESGTCNSLDITQHQQNSLAITQQDNSLDITQQHTTQPEQQISHIQPPISISTPTSTITNSTPTTTQSDYTRQSYRVPSYYAQSLSYIDSRRRR